MLKIIFYISTIFHLYSLSGFAQELNAVSKKDFKKITGKWIGTLTYLDYSTGQPYTMKTDIEIKQIGKSNKFIFSISYPDEPEANSADTLIISENGKFIDDEAVKSKKLLKDGNIEIITELSGKDGNENKPALMRYTYLIGKNIFTKRKDVQFTGETEWIKRHEYNYKK